MKKLLCALVLVSLPVAALASTITYKPIIPSFGGDPDNWGGLLAEADKQNIYHAPRKKVSVKNPIDRFKEQLQYMILSRLASKLVNAAFGDEELPAGTYQIENFQVTVQPQGGEIHVNIVDTSTGSTTEVIVPMYNQ
ncbi:curli production assembly/transport component CsgF [Thermovibrio sp.]